MSCSANIFTKSKKDCRSDKCDICLVKYTIYDNYSDPGFNVDALADMLDVSYETLYHICCKHFYSSPLDLITKVRLMHSLRLFLKSKLPIASISYLSGFARVRTFRNNFKEYFDINPTKIKESLSENGDKEAVIRILMEKLEEDHF